MRLSAAMSSVALVVAAGCSSASSPAPTPPTPSPPTLPAVERGVDTAPPVEPAPPPPDVVIVEGAPPRVGSVAWDATSAPEADALPHFPARGALDGAPFEPAQVSLVWLWGQGAWYLSFLARPSDDPCAPRFRAQGFHLRLRDSRPRAGEVVGRVEHGPGVAEVASSDVLDLSGAADVFPDPDDASTYRSASAAATRLVVDRISETAIEGRVYLAGASASHLLVGAFRGRVCPARGPGGALLP